MGSSGLEKGGEAEDSPGRLFLIRRSHLAIPWQVAPQQRLPPFHQTFLPARSRIVFSFTAVVFSVALENTTPERVVHQAE